MPISQNHDFILKFMKQELGYPIVIPELSDNDFDNFMQQGCERFYNSRPFVKAFTASSIYGTSTIHVSELIPQCFPVNPASWYFIGVVRSDFVINGQQLRNNIDYFLTGAQGTPWQYAQMYQPYNPLADIVLSTSMDMELAQPHFEWNEIDGTIQVTTPSEGQITLGCGFGWLGDGINTFMWDGVPITARRHVAKLSTEEMLRTVIAARSALTITADYNFNPERLERRLEQLELENSKEAEDMVWAVMARAF